MIKGIPFHFQMIWLFLEWLLLAAALGGVLLFILGQGLWNGLRLGVSRVLRRRRLRRLIGRVDRMGSISLGRGDVLLNRDSQKVALGWGLDSSHDLAFDRIEDALLDPENALTIWLKDTSCGEPLQLVFSNAEEASLWQGELTRLASAPGLLLQATKKMPVPNSCLALG